MSGYSGHRRAPGVSQYVHNLNTIPTGHDLPTSELPHLGDDLDFLAHADFFDFDSFNPANVDYNKNRSPAGDHPRHPNVAAVNGPGFQFGEFQTYPLTVGSSPGANGLHGQYPPQPHHQLPFGPQAGDKRKASLSASLPSAADLEETSRMAAEEDKRRRNTAATARFRIKKKQREQALEKAAKEMTDKVQQLEGKVQQLEMENKWLKGLITEKSDGKGVEFTQRENEVERKADEKTDGVGTFEEDEDDMDDDLKSEA